MLNQLHNPIIADHVNWGGPLSHVLCSISWSPLQSVLTIVHLKLCDYKITGFQTTEKYEITFPRCPSQIVHYLFIYLQSVIIDKMMGDDFP